MGVVLWVILVVLAAAGTDATIPPCSRNTSSVIGSTPFQGLSAVEPLGFAMDPREVLDSGVSELMETRLRSAVFFVKREHLSGNEAFLRQLVSHGHHLGLSFLVDMPEHSLKYEPEIVKSIALEQSFVESVTAKNPIFVLAPPGGHLEIVSNATKSMGMFVVNWQMQDVEDVIEKLNEEAPPYGRVEDFLETEQIHCAFDRLSCDFIAPDELFYRQCSALRIEYRAREKIDLFKFVPRHMKRLSQELFAEQLVDRDIPSSKQFIQRNRLRVEKAYQKVDEGAHLRDVMMILYSLSDAQIRSGTEEALRYETRDLWGTFLNFVFTLASASLLIFIALQLRRLVVDRETLLPKTTKGGTGILNALSGFSKAE